MKTILFTSALVAAGFLAGSASGRPLNHKRKLITKVVFVTETVADVIVYVDQTGAPFSTSTSNRVDSTTSLVLLSTASEVALPTLEIPLTSSLVAPELVLQPTLTEESLSTVVAPSPEPTAVGVQDATVTSESSSITSESRSVNSVSTQEPEPAPQPSFPDDHVAFDTAAASFLPLGIAWDAYTASAQCKSADEVASEFSKMKDYKIIRVYGVDCEQVPLAVQNARKNGQKLMGGAYLKSSDFREDLSEAIDAYKSAIDQYADGNWDIIQLFTVENERVNDKAMTAPQVVSAIGDARNQLRHLGYNGPVGAVETAPATIDNPSICRASDIVTVNIHAFFDRHTKAADAGSFVKGQVQQVKSACNNKRVVVTESGWPHQGNANGYAVPSPDSQRAAIQSIRDNFNSDMFLFSAFDTRWKANTASTFNAEQYWGVID
ncbi:glycoside hydrolase family 17 protein [Stemphylium lycopersici]|nr:glycoside hydrolase family 17 protein [Stemphylium lycopersici]